MTTIRRAYTVAVSLLIAIASTPACGAAQAGIGNAEISEWIARHHPNVIAGDRRVNAVLIVVDTMNQYVASVADSLPLAVTAAIDSVFASVGAKNAIEGMARDLVANRLRVPGAAGTPVYLVDGVRVSRVDSLSVNSIGDIKLMNAVEAASKYGQDAATGGAILVTMIHDAGWDEVIAASHRQRLKTLDILPDRIDFGDTLMMHVRSGVFGPYPILVAVLHLKRRSPPRVTIPR